MSTKEELLNLTKQLAEHYRLEHEVLSEGLCRIFNAGSGLEVLRTELFDALDANQQNVPLLGMSFHIETINTDAIMIFEVARKIYPSIQLLGSYYQDATGAFHRNMQAYIMAEQDKENKAKLLAAHEMKVQQFEEWELHRLEKSGKIRIH